MPTINIIPARLRPRAFCEWGIFKSFVRFSILRTIPLLDSIGANNRPLPPKTFGHKNVADEQLKHKQCTESQQSLPDRKILHFQKKNKMPQPSFWDEWCWSLSKQKANQKDFFYIWLDLFSEQIADRLVFCMFDIKLLIFTQSQDILLIFSHRQKLPWPDSNIKYILKFAI